MKFKHLVLYISFFVPFLSSAHSGDYRPMEFVKNEGQWAGDFNYKAITGVGTIFLENSAINITVCDEKNQDLFRKHTKLSAHDKLSFHRYRMVFAGANTDIKITGDKAQPYYYNYYLGNDSTKWRSGIHPNLTVDYKNLYDNIDLHVSSESGQMKYDFIVHPGADADLIQVVYDGISDIDIEDGRLILHTSVGDVMEMKPFAYQYIDEQRKEVKCKYDVSGNVVTYKFPKGYDRSRILIIDPTVVFATFSGSGYDNWGFTATYDQQGNFYAGGIVSDAAQGGGFNTTTGAYDISFNGGSNSTGSKYPCDISIAKFNDVGNGLLFATYLGGNDNEQPHSLIVDNNNDLVICGRAYSNDYPTTAGAYDATRNGGGDIIISKLNATGTTLIASTFIGGSSDDVVNFDAEEFVAGNLKHNYGDDARSEVIVDNANNIYVAGCTRSTDFPVTSNATQSTLAGAQDAVIFKMNPTLTALTWSTYIGGSADDAAYVLALNSSQNQLFVAGGTMSSNFPSTSGTLNSTAPGGIDGFVLRFQNGGAYALQRGTFIGTGNYDQCYGIQLNSTDEVYIMGQSMGGTFPVTSGVYSNPNSSQFIMKLNNDLSTNLISTVYGSGTSTATNISPVAFLVDTCENVYISGWGGDIYTASGATPPPGTGTTQNMPFTSNAAQQSTDGRDFYFIVLGKNLTTLVYATFQGGGSSVPEHVDGGTSRFDKGGIVYQAICGGCGASSAFPVTTGSYSTTNKSNNCNLIALKIAFNLGAVSAQASAKPNAVVCLGEPVNFSSNGSSNVTSYFWDFGDNNTSTQAAPSHTYAQGGTFDVMLVVNNPDACIVTDTAYLKVIVDTSSINADFTVKQTDSCEPFSAEITNSSKTSGSGNETYSWKFGDGSTFTGPNPPPHIYQDTGTYTITLTMDDPDACNAPDTVTKTISFNRTFVKANYEGPPKICVGTETLFNNLSQNGITYSWDFGDGKAGSDLASPYHLFDSVGIFSVKLRAINPGTCNGIDSMIQSIEVLPIPTADFVHDPIIPVTNDPVNFTNRSIDATSFIWNFGDGTSSDLETPRPKYYRRTGDYTVCLQAINSVGCSDTFCRKVSADVYPLADVPNAFTPNGDGENDILYVRGSGIELLNFRIYNRWGELVFETDDQETGWDGSYKDKEQPVEAYAYVLNVTFIDGTTFSKKGNVSLLR